MRSTTQFSITLPNEMADRVRARVERGEYASESEVIREGLRALEARDHAVERWLIEEVVPAYDALREGDARVFTVDEVRSSIAKRRGLLRESKSR
jgi:putative addiction module CopG family antidote